MLGESEAVSPAHAQQAIPTCRSCRFWHGTRQTTEERSAFPTILSGSCRRNAPLPSPTGDPAHRACWPETAPEDWCGDYQVRR